MNPLRLASRTSRLAMIQADEVSRTLSSLGVPCTIIPVESSGDLDRTKPIYEMGVQGVFTKELDVSVLDHHADIAVHSLKDMPVVPARGLMIGAVLPREDSGDVLVHKGVLPESRQHGFTVATSSIRRMSQWKERFPHHETVSIRGNIETRLQKLSDSPFDGVIMARAAINRLQLSLPFVQNLAWMLPAPGQGTIAVVCRQDDTDTKNVLDRINDRVTDVCVNAERDFLHTLKGGCSAPISALAVLRNGVLNFTGAVHSLDGRIHVRVERTFVPNDYADAGKMAAEDVLRSDNGRKILDEIIRKFPS